MSKKAKGVLAVLGHGIDSRGRPSVYTERRGQTTAEYYLANSSKIGRIVCSGRYPRKMINPPDNGGTEAGSLADITNFIEMKSKGLLDDTEIDSDNPFKIVTGQSQAPRAFIIGRRTLALPRQAVESVISPGEDSRREIALEYFATTVAHLVLLGVEPGNLEAIEKARLRYDKIADRVPSHHNEFGDMGYGPAAINPDIARELVIASNSQGLIEF
jgi:hypothetical protein